MKDDNRPENLQPMTAAEHMQLHGVEQLRFDYHGTAGGYTNHRCRCDECRTAWAKAHREYVRRRAEQGRPIKYPSRRKAS